VDGLPSNHAVSFVLCVYNAGGKRIGFDDLKGLLTGKLKIKIQLVY